MGNESVTASLLALALEEGMQVGLRVQRGERPELHLRLKKGEETLRWTYPLATRGNLIEAIEEICSFALHAEVPLSAELKPVEEIDLVEQNSLASRVGAKPVAFRPSASRSSPVRDLHACHTRLQA